MKNYNKLDVSAKLFPSVTNKKNSSVFRLSVVLKDVVDPYYLQLAVNFIYERYSLFFMKLKKGVFWNYFEKNCNYFTVEEEKYSPCDIISSNKNNGFIIKVLYHNNRISIEAFHSITDGSGILEMLKSLIYYYICIKENKNFEHENKILLFNEKVKNDNDSFVDYFKDKSLTNKYIINNKNSYRITGKRFKFKGSSVVTGILSVKQIKNAIKKYECTITAFLTSIMIQAIYDSQNNKSWAPIVVAVPINLRKVFPSKTLKNFFGVINVGFEMNNDTRFKDLVNSINEQLKLASDKDYLEEQTNKNVKLSNNIVSTFTPLVIKNILMPIGFNYLGEIKKTITISNVGIIDFPSDITKFIKYSETVLYPTEKSPINCGVCSFGDNLSISFTRSIVDTNVIKSFFLLLTKKYKLDVSVYSNEWGEDNEKM